MTCEFYKRCNIEENYWEDSATLDNSSQHKIWRSALIYRSMKRKYTLRSRPCVVHPGLNPAFVLESLESELTHRKTLTTPVNVLSFVFLSLESWVTWHLSVVFNIWNGHLFTTSSFLHSHRPSFRGKERKLWGWSERPGNGSCRRLTNSDAMVSHHVP